MRSYKQIALHRKVVVNLKSGRAMQGILVDARGPLLVLRNVVVHEPGVGGSMPMDGEVIVERAEVDFVQVT